MINCVIIIHYNISTNHAMNEKDAVLLSSLAEGLQFGKEERAVFSFLNKVFKD